MSNAALLYYAPTPEGWENPLKRLCAVQGVRFRQVEAQELALPLSILLQGGAPLPPTASPTPVPEAVFVLCGLSGGALDRMLAGLKRIGVPRTALKAVLTPSNAGWTFPQLWGELARERLSFG